MILKHLFQPSSVAVIGASREPTKLGHIILKNIIASGYKGKIYPVNPTGVREILGLKCYADVSNLLVKTELMIFSIQAPIVLPTLKHALNLCRGIKSAVIITAGFKEIGPDGARMEREIQTLLKQHHIATIGPNCIGFIDTTTPLNATFSATEKMPPRGHIAFFSQSGALSMAVLDWAIQEKIGISKLISLGNKIDIDEVSLLEFLGKEKDVKVILAYLEGIENGRKFMEVAGELSRFKPIIILKGGSTAAGSRAASSHTGSLAGQDRAYQSAFIQSGVIRVETISDLFDIASAFTTYLSLPLKGPRIGIVTNSGGPAVMATDRIERSKLLKMAEFSQETLTKLRNSFPAGANIYNPIDVIADANYERYKLALNLTHNDKNVDGILVIYTPAGAQQPEFIAKATVEIFQKTQKPILTCFMGGEIALRAIKIIKQSDIPCYPSPERAILAFEALLQHYRWQTKPHE
ncbi:MAG: CoA-binding protein, partial [Planctomycetota bacterium]|nr:CoA-binding protein [Planctomycetota bacterium]